MEEEQLDALCDVFECQCCNEMSDRQSEYECYKCKQSICERCTREEDHITGFGVVCVDCFEFICEHWAMEWMIVYKVTPVKYLEYWLENSK